MFARCSGESFSRNGWPRRNSPVASIEATFVFHFANISGRITYGHTVAAGTVAPTDLKITALSAHQGHGRADLEAGARYFHGTAAR